MKIRPLLAIVAAVIFANLPVLAGDGWTSLFNGTNLAGWRSPKSDAFPTNGWLIKDGELTVVSNSSGAAAIEGDIITRKRFTNFEFAADFKITPGAKGGIKYLVQPDASLLADAGVPSPTSPTLGLQFQILDDALNPDAKLGRDGDHTLASLYDVLPAAPAKKANPVGEWNSVRIIVRGNHVEHWLNGVKVLEYERGSPEFRAAVAQSKYKNTPGFGEWPDGHILLQQHGFEVSFRNLRIKEISQVPPAR
jgi:hypothetical protein